MVIAVGAADLIERPRARRLNQDRRADTGLDRLPGELVDWLAKPFASFLRIEAAGGAILLMVTIAALVLSNSPWADQLDTSKTWAGRA